MDCSTDQVGDLNVTPKPEPSSPLLKSRSTRTPKPNSFIFSSENEVRMPRKRMHSKKNQLIKNSIKTINKKAKLTSLKAKPKNGLNGYGKTKATINNAYSLKGYNGLSNAKNSTTNDAPDNRAPKLTKRRYVKRKKRLDSDQAVLNSSSDDTESSTFSSNENKKNIANLKPNEINHLFTKQPVTKNGKIRGRPRKPIKIDSLLNVLSNGVPGGQNVETGFKHLLEKIGESHNHQMNKLRKEMEEKDREKVVLNVKNASLIKENESLRARIASLINESELRKELEDIKRLHSQEIVEIKKMRWVSGLFSVICSKLQWTVLNARNDNN